MFPCYIEAAETSPAEWALFAFFFTVSVFFLMKMAQYDQASISLKFPYWMSSI